MPTHQIDADVIDELVALVLAFHIKTGASVEDIQALVRKIGEINSKMAIRVMQQELEKI